MSFFHGSQHTNVSHSQFNSVHGSQINLTTVTDVLKTLRSRICVEAQYNSRNRYPPPCEPDTRTDILQRISNHLAEPGSHSIYSLYGSAGSGKSAIAQSVSEHFAKSGRLAASFFFNSQEKERCSTERVIPTIAYQLAVANPVLKRHICDVLNQDETILDQVVEVQLQKLVIEPLKLLPPSDSPFVMVADGLDECEDYDKMADLMMRLSDPTSELRFPWRFFITSRHDPAIRKVIEDTNINPPHSRSDLTQFSADDDIHLYLKRNLDRVRDMRPTVSFELPWPSNDKLAALVKRSSGLFIYASTAVKFIAEKGKLPPEQLDRILNVQDSPPLSDLDQLYKKVLSASLADIGQLRFVLGTIILIRFPLGPRELGYLLDKDINHLHLVLDGLYSILSISEDHESGSVTPVHLSLQEFLTSRDRAGDFFIDTSLIHTDLARCCLNRIRTLPKFTFNNSSDPKDCWDAVTAYMEQIDMAKRLATRYACRYWSSHLSEFSPTDDHLMREMKDFCRHYILPWRMFTEMDVQHDGTPNQQLTRARELVQTETMLLHAARSARRRTKQLIIILGSMVMLGFLVAIVVVYVANATPWIATICWLPVMLIVIVLTIGRSVFEPSWIVVLMGVVVLIWLGGVVIGVLTVLRGLRAKEHAVSRPGVILTVISAVGFIHGLWFWFTTRRKAHTNEASRMAWRTGVVKVQQHDIRRCVLESREWIHRMPRRSQVMFYEASTTRMTRLLEEFATQEDGEHDSGAPNEVPMTASTGPESQPVSHV